MAKKAAATAEPEISRADQANNQEIDPELSDPPEDALLTEEDDLDDGAEEEPEAAGLEELGAAELNMLTEDEAAEALRVDEAAEVESLRKAELALQDEGEEISADEFVCTSCFLMKRTSQLANKSKKICKDCAA
jgi:hypothetical protein